MPRTRVHDEALRTRLLEDTVRTLTQDGPGALSLRSLAAGAGTSTSAVYSLFGGKPGLLNAVYDEGFRRFGERLATVPAGDDPRERLLALALAYRESALAAPNFYHVMFGSAGREVTPEPESRRRAEATFAVLLDAVEAAVPGRDSMLIASSMWGMVHGLVSLELRGVLPADQYRPTVHAFVAGWLTPDG